MLRRNGRTGILPVTVLYLPSTNAPVAPASSRNRQDAGATPELAGCQCYAGTGRMPVLRRNRQDASATS